MFVLGVFASVLLASGALTSEVPPAGVLSEGVTGEVDSGVVTSLVSPQAMSINERIKLNANVIILILFFIFVTVAFVRKAFLSL